MRSVVGVYEGELVGVSVWTKLDTVNNDGETTVGGHTIRNG